MFDDRNVSPANQKLLWQHYYDTLAKGVDAGYNPTVEMYDPALAHSLKYDIAKFSAFKETSFRKQLESALTKNGKIVPWSEFKKNADVLSTQYNRQWLKTEYNHTVATANMAQQWQGFEADKDLYPNLRYNAVDDGRTREQHKAWDGLILPIEHVFWKSHLPPNDWGCRCNVEQTDDMPTVEMPEILIKGAFNNNAALSGKVFAEVPYASGLSSAEKIASEKFASEMMKGYKSEMSIIEAKKQYEAIEKTFKKEFFNEETGGYLAIDKQRITDAKISKNEAAKFLKEKNMATVFGNSGMKIKMLKEVPGVSSADVLADNILAELKQTSSHNNILKYVKKANKKQGAKMILFEFTKETPEILKEIENLKRLKSKVIYFFTGKERVIYKTF